MAILAGVAFVVGVALGPVLDRIAQWSLREDADAPWRRRGLLTGVIAGTGAAVAVVCAPSMDLAPAWIALALVGAVIVRTDAVRHRIPDPLTLAAFGGGAVLLATPALTALASGAAPGASLAAYGRAWAAALAVGAAFLAVALVGPAGLGMGDAKLAPTLGLYLGYLGWSSVLVGILAGFVLGALVGLALVVADARARRPVAGSLRRAIAFGPYLLAGTFVGLASA